MDENYNQFNKSEYPPFIWCLVGNIIDVRYFGEGKELIIRGTKKFTARTKVYCFPPLWGDGYEEIQVIGKLRRRKHLKIIITSSKFITNWRIQKVFNPFIIRTMKDNGGWDETDDSKEIIENMLKWLSNVTMKVDRIDLF
jgi:hypothetical protein